MKLKISDELKYIIGKTDRREGNGWLPFYMHALDTMKMIELLVHCRYDGMHELCGMSKSEFLKTVRLLALLHDIGNVTPAFQSLIMASVNFECRYASEYAGCFKEGSDYRKNSHHPIAGESILIAMGINKAFASVVGAHHGMPPSAIQVDKNIQTYPKNYYGNLGEDEFWTGLWDEWISISMELAGFASKEDIPLLSKKAQVLLSGLLITADWIASDSDKFPLLELDCVLLPEYDETRAEEAWAKLRFTEVWSSEMYCADNSVFHERFGFDLREVQEAVLDIVNEIEKPGIMILEAPMGIGKTEIALMAAEVMACRADKHGVFFGLPTQTTANGIFGRFMSWAGKQSDGFYHSIMLAHTNADFQPAFSSLPRHVPDVEYDIEHDDQNGLIVHSFFMGRKQSCMAEFVVGTVDRMLMAALKRKHTMLLHLGLSQKVVIVDECHAYDAYMNCYLERAIEWLGAYDVPVILLSATLPPSRRKALMAAYLRTKEKKLKLEDDNAYPSVTWSDGGKIYRKAIEYPHENTDVSIERMSDAEALKIAADAAKRGACVGIICNTVKKAQELAEQAAETEKLMLYHAQYILPDRVEKEEQILAAAGKYAEPGERAGLLVIGTQVLEQSLDIDFDLLITELCPMDLLLQRMGRLFRHKEHIRPKGVDTARCIVIKPEDGELDKGSRAVYGDWLLMQTEKILPESISIPDDISQLVSDVYECESFDTDDEEDAYREYSTVVNNKESRASGFLLGKYTESKYGATLDGWLDQGVHDAAAEASVRDGGDSVEVLVMVSPGDGYAEFLPWISKGERILLTECPPPDIAKKIAQQCIRLPRALCSKYNIDDTIRELENMDNDLKAWQESYWLRGELILFLDRSLTAELNGYKLSYSREKGMSYEQIKEEV